jgi:NAD(P)-dependent dehydrogenase (short-subunit alcohol dehydrogenase family)
LGAATVEDIAEEDYGRVMDVCVRGTFLGMKHAIRDAANEHVVRGWQSSDRHLH